MFARMTLAVVIVAHNSAPHLLYCLDAVKAATASQSARIVLVDNNSADIALTDIQHQYPFLTIIENKENLGFARACNQGWRSVDSELVLFLNPDCIVSSEAISNCIEHFRQHSESGAVGVQMINARGEFLPESKRSFPRPMSSFFKLTGLASLFSGSSKLNAYYAPAISKNDVAPAEILSGAFMMVPRKLLEVSGGFDERYFMYAEDIDLSITIQRSGYRNYYLGSTVVLHFKGTSTPRDRQRVQLFYKAMKQFVVKHWDSSGRRWLLLIGIRLKEGLELLKISRRSPLNPRAGIIDYCLKGDLQSMDSARSLLTGKDDAVIRSAPVKGCSILLCIGQTFTYEDVIKTIQQNSGFDYSLYSPALGKIIS